MKEEKKEEVKTTKDNSNKKSKIALRTIVVLIAVAIFAIASFVTYRATYLNVISVGKEYETIFTQKYENKIGPVPRTSYRDGLWQTIEYMKDQQ